MIKSFMDSFLTSINIKSIEDNVSKIEATMKKHIEKTVYLENQSRRNNLRFEGLLEDDNETWDETEAKV
ncbi:unnamed protein product [Porites evermanni]|uniref:Uncharacterized protein n=1 Tax=Porites evermanni TaxID=104178 RepID=A0ABN8SQU7_9CNID|nr:unnamed protein product [Porites evermanni]